MTNGQKESEKYRALSPWAEADPRPLRAISPRPEEIGEKKIGFFVNSKRGAAFITEAVEKRLKEEWPSVKTSRYGSTVANVREIDSPNKDKFVEWVKGVDAVMLAEKQL